MNRYQFAQWWVGGLFVGLVGLVVGGVLKVFWDSFNALYGPWFATLATLVCSLLCLVTAWSLANLIVGPEKEVNT